MKLVDAKEDENTELKYSIFNIQFFKVTLKFGEGVLGEMIRVPVKFAHPLTSITDDDELIFKVLSEVRTKSPVT